MKFFGDEYPRDRLIREEMLEEFYEKNGEEEIPMEEYEDAIATDLEEENDGFEVAADKYANKG